MIDLVISGHALTVLVVSRKWPNDFSGESGEFRLTTGNPVFDPPLKKLTMEYVERSAAATSQLWIADLEVQPCTCNPRCMLFL